MYLTIAVLAAILILLVLDVTGPDMIFGAALIVLLFGGIISPEEALSGFSNRGMVTVGLLFIVSRAVENTGVFQTIAERFLSAGTNDTHASSGSTATVDDKRRLPALMVRMMAPVTILSAFLNNTPIVTIFTPTIRQWTTERRLAASKFLIPLSYASIFGGILTLIGTSTNLVVHGLMIQSDLEGLRFFEVARAGLPIAIMGYLYLVFFGQRILPERHDVMAELDETPREYFIELLVPETSPLIGKTVEQARLRNLQGVYLTDIERGELHLGPVTPDRRLAAGDRLFFAGRTDGMKGLVAQTGLVPVGDETLLADTRKIRRHLVEVVVSSSSPVLGRTIKESNFRTLYGAAVIAISRNGERVPGRLGDVDVRTGDTLVLLTNGSFARKYRYSRDFLLVSPLDRIAPEVSGKGGFALVTVVGMVLLSAVGEFLPTIAGHRIDMFYAAAGAVLVLVLGRAITPNQAREAIRWDVLITIGAAFGVSRGLFNSGAAQLISQGMVDIMAPFGTVGALVAVYLATSIFTEIITNNAAAALMFPIALVTAAGLAVDPAPFMVAVAVGASASFATPIGYQTNLIVQGPGGYRFSDFLRVGVPMNIVAGITGITAIALWYGLV